MGYTTDFSGCINVVPPLNAEEIAYLNKFAETRRMDREQGPYFVDGDDVVPSDAKGHWLNTNGQYAGPGSGVRNSNAPDASQPGLWCQWVPSEDGTYIEWDGGEKFYDSAEWMKYLIDHFLKPGALAQSALPFLQCNHTCNGEIEAQGEDNDDRWVLFVENNVVYTAQAQITVRPGSKELV